MSPVDSNSGSKWEDGLSIHCDEMSRYSAHTKEQEEYPHKKVINYLLEDTES